MHVILSVKHDLLAVPLRRVMIHASVSCLTAHFIKCGAVIGEDAEE
jgi:hypothetical protein